jgi:hypothetical protein
MARARASTISFDRLVKLIRGGEEKHSEVAKKLGVAPSALDMMTFHRARVTAGVAKKAPATGKSVRDLRDRQKCRWEEIAARIGTGVAAAKTLYEEAGGDSTNYVGRGRNWNGTTEETPKTSKRGAAKRSTTKRSAAKASAAKPAKRGSAKRGATKRGTAQGPTRARTRAERQARAGSNPS